jgi:hypothetical protein
MQTWILEQDLSFSLTEQSSSQSRNSRERDATADAASDH